MRTPYVPGVRLRLWAIRHISLPKPAAAVSVTATPVLHRTAPAGTADAKRSISTVKHRSAPTMNIANVPQQPLTLTVLTPASARIRNAGLFHVNVNKRIQQKDAGKPAPFRYNKKKYFSHVVTSQLSFPMYTYHSDNFRS